MGLGYISVRVSPLTESLIRERMHYAGVMPLDEGDYHATLIYDRRAELTEPLTDIPEDKTYSGTITGIKEMGYREDGLINAMTFSVSSGDLLLEHERLKEAGYKHSFPDYEAHVSFAYELDSEQAENIKLFMKDLIGQPIYFHKETLTMVEK